MKGTPAFSKSAVALLIAAATTLFALSILLSAFDDKPKAGSGGGRSGPGTFSTSAVGHAGIYDVLKRLGRPVERGQGGEGGLNRRATLVVIEPDVWRVEDSDNSKLAAARRLLLVLPKWQGVRSDVRPAWVSHVYPARPIQVDRTLALADKEGRVVQAAWPEKWTVNEVGYLPAGSGKVQLMRSDKMRPVVACAEGLLVGEIVDGDRKVLVLADPDVTANHGLVQGDNAAFTVALIDGLRSWNNSDDRAPIVFDETLHGFLKSTESPLKLLFRFPLAVITILVVMATGLLAWSGAGRFGAPLVPRPPIDFGKTTLIGNGARLLDYAGHHAEVLKRYVRMAIRTVAATLHAPANLDDYGQAEWLDRLGRSRGVRGSCRAILGAVDHLGADDEKNLGPLYESVWAIHRWKGEILNEHSARRGHS